MKLLEEDRKLDYFRIFRPYSYIEATAPNRLAAFWDMNGIRKWWGFVIFNILFKLLFSIELYYHPNSPLRKYNQVIIFFTTKTMLQVKMLIYVWYDFGWVDFRFSNWFTLARARFWANEKPFETSEFCKVKQRCEGNLNVPFSLYSQNIDIEMLITNLKTIFLKCFSKFEKDLIKYLK